MKRKRIGEKVFNFIKTHEKRSHVVTQLHDKKGERRAAENMKLFSLY
jgi:hypothetical protein